MATARRSGRSSPSSGWIASRVTLVVGLFLAIVFAQRIWTPRRGMQAANLIEVCGKVPLDAKQYLHLVRIGERLLVLLQSPHGVQRVTEITDAAEVARMLDRLAPAGRSRADRTAQWLLAQSRSAEAALPDSGKDDWR
jgi:hypothetical protein